MLLPIGDMVEARLVLTDALVTELLRRGKERAERNTSGTRAEARYADNDNRVPAEKLRANDNEGD